MNQHSRHPLQSVIGGIDRQGVRDLAADLANQAYSIDHMGIVVSSIMVMMRSGSGLYLTFCDCCKMTAVHKVWENETLCPVCDPESLRALLRSAIETQLLVAAELL